MLAGALAPTLEPAGSPNGMNDLVYLERMYQAGAAAYFDALAIHTSAGTVLHTGDWKIDPTPIIGVPTDERRLRELGDSGVLALIGDSTNAVREGRSPSELEVAKTITELVKAAKGRVAVTTFASNVARLRAVADAAKASGREVVVVGKNTTAEIWDAATWASYLAEQEEAFSGLSEEVLPGL